MKRFRGGSIWRKWDLHIHAPGTKLEDGYKAKDGEPDWDQYCRILEESDVAAFGITDYFTFASFFEFKLAHKERYPDSEKTFFPNLELRLPEALNKDGQSVNIHLIFRPDLSKKESERFLTHLTTETTVGKEHRRLACQDLETKDEFKSSTVSRSSIAAAIQSTFGSKGDPREHVLVATAAKGDGIRPGGKGSTKRKYVLVDEIDKMSQGFFGDASNVVHFLDSSRLETSEEIEPKPVFSGSDAHSFARLNSALGKTVNDADHRNTITWIKADPTFEGLQQTLIEPEQRVYLGPEEPDRKAPYKYISSVAFSGSSEFPDEIRLNRNLNSIIGSRSSGKSALLAYIAHSVDPEETVQKQEAATPDLGSPVGPAAGISWADVSDINCEVNWGSVGEARGKVVYIPQNSLYRISEQPKLITEKISPSLFRAYPKFRDSYAGLMQKVDHANDAIEKAVRTWFADGEKLERLRKEIADIGDKDAIEGQQRLLDIQIEEIKESSALSDEEVAKYQEIVGILGRNASQLETIELEIGQLTNFTSVNRQKNSRIVPRTVKVDISVTPAEDEIPEILEGEIVDLIETASSELSKKIEEHIVRYRDLTEKKKKLLQAETKKVETENAKLIEKNKANVILGETIKESKKQGRLLKAIGKAEVSLEKIKARRTDLVDTLSTVLKERSSAISDIGVSFKSSKRELEDLEFGVEAELSPELVTNLTQHFDRKRQSDFLSSGSKLVDVPKVQSNPGTFLEKLENGSQRINKLANPVDVAAETLTATQEIRFSADLDGDKIGGFGRPSMTPGKQALFALTLILNESSEPWPLLIDQPEDDLDSRSIYFTIVPYLVRRKKERQIVMVSHNANLVIGADSEEIIVANRHGDDRKNKGKRAFDYLTGSLEHSSEINRKKPAILDQCGIREHACEILDGGEQAFQKRKDKYKI